jgi:hypothetical protein
MAREASKNRYNKRANSHPGRIELIRKDFENLIEDQGARVRVTPSILCPNRTSLGDTNHVLKCQICGGDEAIDLPNEAVEAWAFIQAIKFDKQFQVQGIWDLKDAMISMMPEIRLYYWYKIEIIDFASVYNQLISRGTGDKDRLRYKPAEITTDTPYYIIDSAGTTYKKEKHYKIVGQDIEWRTVVRPSTGKLYSFAYPVLPTFRVLELMHENRYYYETFKRPANDKAPIQMPQQAVIRWDYLAKDSGANPTLSGT